MRPVPSGDQPATHRAVPVFDPHPGPIGASDDAADRMLDPKQQPLRCLQAIAVLTSAEAIESVDQRRHHRVDMIHRTHPPIMNKGWHSHSETARRAWTVDITRWPESGHRAPQHSWRPALRRRW